MQHSHCSYCGQAFSPHAPWPRHCSLCGEITWLNPLPVGNALLPIIHRGETGLLLVRRNIEPGRGLLALPGGYMELGEVWQESVVRELQEETGIVATADQVTLFDVISASQTLMVFGLLPPTHLPDPPQFTPGPEVSELVITLKPTILAFLTHTRAVERYFSKR